MGQRPGARLSRLPPFVTDLFVSPTARGGLLAGSAALFAAALDPKVYGPSLPSVQAAIRERPDLEALVLLAALGGSSLLLLGGAVGDSMRARKLIVGGLAVVLGTAIVSLLVSGRSRLLGLPAGRAWRRSIRHPGVPRPGRDELPRHHPRDGDRRGLRRVRRGRGGRADPAAGHPRRARPGLRRSDRRLPHRPVAWPHPDRRPASDGRPLATLRGGDRGLGVRDHLPDGRTHLGRGAVG